MFSWNNSKVLNTPDCKIVYNTRKTYFPFRSLLFALDYPVDLNNRLFFPEDYTIGIIFVKLYGMLNNLSVKRHSNSPTYISLYFIYISHLHPNLYLRKKDHSGIKI